MARSAGVDDGGRRPDGGCPVPRCAADPRPENRERVLPRATVSARPTRPVPARPNHHSLTARILPSPPSRSELRGASETPTRSHFATVITHALAKTHGVVGGAVPLDHLSFEPEDIDPSEGEFDTSMKTSARRVVGVVRCHAGDARKLRTALAMLTTTHDGTECVVRTLGEATSLVALAGECAARNLSLRLRG